MAPDRKIDIFFGPPLGYWYTMALYITLVWCLILYFTGPILRQKVTPFLILGHGSGVEGKTERNRLYIQQYHLWLLPKTKL